MESDLEPQFVVEFEINVPESRPGLLAFRIRSKPQPHSNPQQWYKSVAEMMDDQEYESPVFVVKASYAVQVAQDLMEASRRSQDAYDSQE